MKRGRLLEGITSVTRASRADATLVLFMGILASFVAWSLVWALEAREAHMFGSGPKSSEMLIRASGQEYDRGELYADLDRILKDRNLALIVDGEGDGIPGLVVLDPHGVLPWMGGAPSAAARGEASSVYLFDGTYCAERYEETGSCELVPPDGAVVAATDAPAGVGYYQYALVPGDSLTLNAERVVVTTRDHDDLSEIADVLSRHGFTVDTPPVSPLWRELPRDPLVAVSVGLFAVGLSFVSVSWAMRNARLQAEFLVRRSVGATPMRMVRQRAASAIPVVLLGSCGGVAASVPIVGYISGSAVPGEMLWPLAAAAVLCGSVLAVAYAATLALGLWNAARRV